MIVPEIEPKAAAQLIEGVMSGEVFAATEHRRLVGDINPHYLRSEIELTNIAVRAARSIFKIAKVVTEGTEDDELYDNGAPFKSELGSENAEPMQLVPNIAGCSLAVEAKLLNMQKDAALTTGQRFTMGYHGNKLVEKYSPEVAFATPIVETATKAGCIGSLGLTAGGVYGGVELASYNHDMMQHLGADKIGLGISTFSGFMVGICTAATVGRGLNDFRGTLRAKKVHEMFVAFQARSAQTTE